jgi:hypothetical protein
MSSSEATVKPLNWKTDISTEDSLLSPIDWNALEEYAIGVKRKQSDDDTGNVTCQLSAEYSIGGIHIVRRLDFDDGTSWVARLSQQKDSSPISLERMLQDVHTTRVVHERSKIPVPKIFAYEASDDNAIGVAFMIMEYIPADTAMDSFGGFSTHRGEIPPQFKEKYYNAMAEIQVSSI